MKENLIRATHAVKLVGLVALSAILASTPVLGQEIIIDNKDANTRQIGFWWPSSGLNPYLGESLYNQEQDGRFVWEPELPESGDYDVYAWWTYHPNRSSNVPYAMDLGDSFVQVFVDQSDPDLGGQWNLLGRFSFNTRFGGQFIEVSGENGQASADAVRFVRAEQQVSKPWPEANCPCDEYYSRAVDKYLAWGGSMIPQSFGGATVSVLCDDPQNTLDLDARYETDNNVTMVSLRLSVFTTPDVSFAECGAIVESSLVPAGPIYDRGIDSTAADWVEACRASVRDFCESDPSP